MKQVKVSLDDEDVGLLELAASQAGHSLSEEIRTRITGTFKKPSAQETLVLLQTINRLTVLVEKQTKRPWYSHPAAIRVLQDAIVARLERLRGGIKEAEFTLDELPSEDRLAALVGAADQRVWGPALEAIDYHANTEPRRIAVPKNMVPPF